MLTECSERYEEALTESGAIYQKTMADLEPLMADYRSMLGLEREGERRPLTSHTLADQIARRRRR
jgi:hypothetical protein